MLCEHVVDDDRLEDVQLEVPRGAADADRDVVAHHLRAHHRHRFRLRRVHFARHDRAAGFVFGNQISPRPERGPDASQRTSFAIFMSATPAS